MFWPPTTKQCQTHPYTHRDIHVQVHVTEGWQVWGPHETLNMEHVGAMFAHNKVGNCLCCGAVLVPVGGEIRLVLCVAVPALLCVIALCYVSKP